MRDSREHVRIRSPMNSVHNGAKRYRTEIITRQIRVLDRRPGILRVRTSSEVPIGLRRATVSLARVAC